MTRTARPVRLVAALASPLVALLVLLGGAALVPASAAVAPAGVHAADPYVPPMPVPTPSPTNGGVGDENGGLGDGAVGNSNGGVGASGGVLPNTGAEYGVWGAVLAALVALLGGVLVRRSRTAR